MTKFSNSWGPLGYPTPEKIQEYMNMPVGSFRNLVRTLPKNGRLENFKVKLIKVVSTEYDIEKQVQAINYKKALESFADNENFDFTNARVTENIISYRKVVNYL